MPRIFISYRRADTIGVAGRIYDRLVEAFGKDAIFMDVDNIPPGGDFRRVLREAIQKADVVLFLIGQQWEGIMRKRRNKEDDFVRVELFEAIEQRKVTIPVLFNTPMPQVNSLPARLRPVFPYLNAVEVDLGGNFHRDVTRLIAQLKEWETISPPPEIPEDVGHPIWVQRFSRYLALIAAVMLGAFVGVGSFTAYERIANPTGALPEPYPPPLIEGTPTSKDIVEYIQSHGDISDNQILAEVEGGKLGARPIPSADVEFSHVLENGALLIIESRTWDAQFLSTTIVGQKLWMRSGYLRLESNGEAFDILNVPVDSIEFGTALSVLSAYESASRFYDALVSAGLDDMLEESESITVFVPPNSEFDALLVQSGITLQNTEVLRDLLQDYILEGEYQTGDFSDDVSPVNIADIQYANVEVSNGVLHFLDDVITKTE